MKKNAHNGLILRQKILHVIQQWTNIFITDNDKCRNNFQYKYCSIMPSALYGRRVSIKYNIPSTITYDLLQYLLVKFITAIGFFFLFYSCYKNNYAINIIMWFKLNILDSESNDEFIALTMARYYISIKIGQNPKIHWVKKYRKYGYKILWNIIRLDIFTRAKAIFKRFD